MDLKELELKLEIAKADAKRAWAESRKARDQLTKARIEAGELKLSTQMEKAAMFIRERADMFKSQMVRKVMIDVADALDGQPAKGEQLIDFDERMYRFEQNK